MESGLHLLGQRKVFCDAPHPPPPPQPFTSLAYQVLCVETISQKGEDKEEPEGKPHRWERRKQREDSESGQGKEEGLKGSGI